MREVTIFAEDFAHEQVLKALLKRLTDPSKMDLTLTWRNVRNGRPAVMRELKQFLRDLRRGAGGFPDLMIVATDGNCMGYTARRNEIQSLADQVAVRTVVAVPDPHIERWLMLDSNAFKAVFDTGCDPPDRKCERDRYKRQFLQAIRKSGIQPSLGGIEFADDIVAAMDIAKAAAADASFGHFVADMRATFTAWTRQP